MKRLFFLNYDVVALGSSLTVLVLSFGWFWHLRGDYSEKNIRPVEMSFTADYQPLPPLLNSNIAKAWSKPLVQSSGGNWLYEVFTPPAVFYDRLSASFTVSPPAGSEQASVEPFDVQLVSVEKEPFRVQLAGYFGEAGAYRVLFVCDGLPNPVIVRKGDRIRDLDLTLRDFSVSRVAPAVSQERDVDEIAAVAELFDERAGVVVGLDSRSQKFSGAFLANLRSGSFEGGSRKVRVGEEFSDPNYSYQVERIGDHPGEVVLTRRKTGTAATEVATLRLPGDLQKPITVAQANSVKNFPNRPATEIVSKE